MGGILNLEGKRRSAERRLPDLCIIYQGADGDDGEGGHTTQYTSRTADPLACRFTTLTGVELERAQQIVAEAKVSLTLPALTAVESTDRIVVTRAEDSAQFGLEAVYVVEKSQPITRQVLCSNLNAT